ncbi:expressed unknown protein [Seminavis robusta]|uniref:Uncharacterized protein n=1 Tax=Seminavis robusta TaxID=568900 RepID=A0A9N8HJJ7_9STRA|nr:expressed unknown protein [Seminavis robusta]|eukprot:Sro865_g212910.1 n/a (398) ;mRNA; r:35582-36775
MKIQASAVQNVLPKIPFHPVDLALPKDKLPTTTSNFSSLWGTSRTVADLVGREYAIGSSMPSQEIFYQEDTGIFACVYESWKNHWNLRTSPEDWWFPVACRVAKGVDKAAKSGYGSEKVRELFVDHEGKENICVDVDVFNIYQVDYEDFFSRMSSEITGKLKVPEFAKAMQNDFSTSTTTHGIASQINLMASMQEFFSYEMGLRGCGIKGVEMLGQQEDWDRLVTKIQKVRKELEPIMGSLPYDVSEDWFDHVEQTYVQLAKTYAAKDSKSLQEAADFWADIFMIGDGWKYGPSGFGGHAAKKYNGWLIQFLTGHESVLEEDFWEDNNREKLKGLNSVPMKVTMKWKQPPVDDKATLVAGIMGFEKHEETFNGVPSLQPNHMWAMKLKLSSPLRRLE